MLTSVVLPLFGLLSIYHTFCRLITYVLDKLHLILCTVLIIFLQTVFKDQIIPHNYKFNTKDPILQTYTLYGTHIILINH